MDKALSKFVRSEERANGAYVLRLVLMLLSRETNESARQFWNTRLAFPQYDWMNVRGLGFGEPLALAEPALLIAPARKGAGMVKKGSNHRKE